MNLLINLFIYLFIYVFIYFLRLRVTHIRTQHTRCFQNKTLTTEE